MEKMIDNVSQGSEDQNQSPNHFDQDNIEKNKSLVDMSSNPSARDNSNGVKGAQAGGSMETSDGDTSGKNKSLIKRSEEIDRSADPIGVNDVEATEAVAGSSTQHIDEDLGEKITRLGNGSEDMRSNPSNEAEMEGVSVTIETAPTGGAQAEEIIPGPFTELLLHFLLPPLEDVDDDLDAGYEAESDDDSDNIIDNISGSNDGTSDEEDNIIEQNTEFTHDFDLNEIPSEEDHEDEDVAEEVVAVTDGGVDANGFGVLASEGRQPAMKKMRLEEGESGNGNSNGNGSGDANGVGVLASDGNSDVADGITSVSAGGSVGGAPGGSASVGVGANGVGGGVPVGGGSGNGNSGVADGITSASADGSPSEAPDGTTHGGLPPRMPRPKYVTRFLGRDRF